MKCPNCGADNPDHVFYCGKCAATVREPEVTSTASEPVRESERITLMAPLIKNDLARMLTKIGGAFAVFFGLILGLAGAYGLLGGTAVVFRINDRVVSPEEGGRIFLAIGAVVLLIGMALLKAGYLKRRVKEI